MAWIESHISLEKHLKLSRFRRIMRWSRNESVGFLHRFWWIVLEHAPDGVLTPSLSTEAIADLLDMGVGLVRRAMTAMEDVGFLQRAHGSLLVHDWLEYAGRYLRDSRFKRSPDKWLAACRVHGVGLESPQTVGRQSAVPNHTSTNLPLSAKEKTKRRLLERSGKETSTNGT